MTTSVALGGIARAAAWDGQQVWVLDAGGGVAAFGADGGDGQRRAGVRGLRSLAAGPEGLVGAGAGAVVWLGREGGDEVARRPVGGDPVLVGDAQEGVFAVDRQSERAWPVTGTGAVGPPAPVPGVASATVARGAVWWTSRHDSVLRGNGMEVELPAPAGAPVAGCAGSVWVGVEGALLRVGAWGGDTSPPLKAPSGPAVLACGDGRLVGASAGGAFLLDPSADAGLQRLDVELREAPALVVVTDAAAWLFSATEPSALVVPFS